MGFFPMAFGTSVTGQDLEEQNNAFEKIGVGNLSIYINTRTVQIFQREKRQSQRCGSTTLFMFLLSTAPKITPPNVFLG